MRRNLVRLYSVEEIIEETEVLREAAEIPDSIPFRVIHFASLYRSDGYEFVLRRGFLSEEWRVMLASYSTFTDLDLDMPDQNDLVCDWTFTDWVHRMIVTDCLPVRPGQPGINDDVSTQRLLRRAEE